MKRIFLVGCPRSGTTLLQSLLASHSRITSFPETHLLSKTIPIQTIAQFFKIYGPGSRRILKKQLIHLGLEQEQINLPNKTIFKTTRWISFILSNIDNLAKGKRTSGTTHWLEKTPRHLQYVDLLHQSDSSIRFIHIIREGKDVVPSLYYATQENPNEWNGARSLKKCVFWWNRSVKQSSQYLQQQKHIHVSYEQLTNEPKPVLEALCQFLELPYESGMIEQFSTTATSLIEDSESWKERNTENHIDASSKLDRLTQEEQAYVSQNVIHFPYNKIKF